MRILLKGFTILPSPDRPPEEGSLVISGERIAWVGVGSPEPESDSDDDDGPFDRVLEGQGRLVMPGLVNAHTHLAMVLFRGFADDLPLKEWLEGAIWPAERHLKPQEVYWATLLGCAELLHSGVTAFADMYFYMDEVARAVEVSGLRAQLAYGMIAPDPEKEGPELERGLELVKRWHGAAEGRIQVALAPHAPYTCGAGLWERAVELAQEHKVMIHTHLAETEKEVADSLERHGRSPVEYLEDLGVFSIPVLAAHCVHLSERDIEILAEHDVRVVHNPTSNMKLGSGVAPVQKLLAAGVNVALGTDGAASNNDLDMWEEMRLAALLAKQSGEPTALPAPQALRLATTDGARALGLPEGEIREGAPADLIILNLERAHLIPQYNLVSNLVYAAHAADVETVIVAGEILMEEGRIMKFDEEEAKAKVREISALYRELRLSPQEL